MLWTKITIHTVNVCGSGYFHIGGGNDIVDLFLIFKVICYNLALVGVTIEKGLHWLPQATIATRLQRGVAPWSRSSAPARGTRVSAGFPVVRCGHPPILIKCLSRPVNT